MKRNTMSTAELVAVGDVSLTAPNDSDPFYCVTEDLKPKDILFCNLEVVLSDHEKRIEKAVILQSNPERASFLRKVGFDIVNVANNHILDLGSVGLKQTLETLQHHSIRYIGACYSLHSTSEILVLERKGFRFGFLGYTAGLFTVPDDVSVSKIREEKIIEDIKAAKVKCDFVVVSLHWGIENTFFPSPGQIEFAHSLVANGASLILGHGPHVIQGIERYQRGLVAYSLGNFNFDPAVSRTKSRNSMILRVTFDEEGIRDYTIVPVSIEAGGVPTPANPEKGTGILGEMSDLSRTISRGVITNGWWYDQVAYEYLMDSFRSYSTRIRRSGLRPLAESCFWCLKPFTIRCCLALIAKRLRSTRGRAR